VNVRQKKDAQGRLVTVFICQHAQPRRVSQAEAKERGWCTSSTVGSRSFACGKSAADRNPRADREEGCPGGLKVCGACKDIVGQLLRKAYDAKAVRAEFIGEGLA
jgi:hypothetical protein